MFFIPFFLPFARAPAFDVKLRASPPPQKTGPIIYEDRKVITYDGHVLNRLTPAYQKPEWVKFLEHQSGFFSLLLWAGAVLCFIGYGLRNDIDNVSG